MQKTAKNVIKTLDQINDKWNIYAYGFIERRSLNSAYVTISHTAKMS